MPLFRVLIGGENFNLEFGNRIEKAGFWAGRIVEAQNSDEAKSKALKLLWTDDYWKDSEKIRRSPNAKVFVDEVEQIEEFPEDYANAGHSFFVEEDEE